MGTPTGARANEARGYFARERRRVKQNQKAFDIAGYFATPFDFGATAAGGSSANALTLPADIKIAFSSTAELLAQQIGVENISDAETYLCPSLIPVGAVVNMTTYFRQRKQIRIARAVGSPAATVSVYFRGPDSELVQIGVVTFT